MLPTGIGLGWADPRLAHDLLPGEALPRAVLKRHRAFSAGRAAARMAMERPEQSLPMCRDRSPLWPTGICGSISHSDSACLAIAAPLSLYRGLGIDLEPALPLEPALWETVLTAAEQTWLAGLPAAQRGLTAKLIFSAKEAAYKAQYRISEHLFGYDGLDVSFYERTFTIHLTAAIPGFADACGWRGQWQVTDGHLLTLVTILA